VTLAEGQRIDVTTGLVSGRMQNHGTEDITNRSRRACRQLVIVDRSGAVQGQAGQDA